MKKFKFENGRAYKIRFYDHCIGIKEAMVCEVMGWVIKEDKTSLILTHWRVDNKDKTMVDDNHEPVTIVKSCIIRTKKLD